MPVSSKKGNAKSSKSSKVSEPEPEEEEIDEEEIDEEDDIEDDDTDDLDTEDEDEDNDSDEDEDDNTDTPVPAPPRGRGRPRGANNPGIDWDDEKDAALIKTMRRIASGKLPGAHPLTPAAVVEHLKSHEAFSGVAQERLTPAVVAGRAKSRAKALAKIDVEIPTFPVKVKPNIATLAALLEDDDE